MTLTNETVAPAELLTGWDTVELWVGNARAAAHWLATGFGFDVVGYAGPETGVRDHTSWLLQQGDIRFLLTAPLTPDSEVMAHVRAHGDGVKRLSFSVPDVEQAFRAAVDRGAVPVTLPHERRGDGGTVIAAEVATYGETVHAFVDRRGYEGFGPGFTTDGLFQPIIGDAVELRAIDHIVGNVEEGVLEGWVRFYEDTFGFRQMTHFDRDQISTEYSALRSTVVFNGGRIVMPINEPAQGRRKSQIQEYLDAYGGPGVQHIALATDDIVASVASLRDRGVRFLTPPPAYYEDARRRLDGIDLPWDDLARLGILVDRESGGYLLQVFTETFGDRPTLFFEVIQREGATGFGEGNFKALFEAIEREQERRGNL
jgi:4-hydroxyphenylpyruvate dioxygenase